MTSTYAIVLTTAPNRTEAKNIAKHILEAELAACVQLSSIDSLFVWENKLEQEAEVKLLIKTKSELYAQIEKMIAQHHSYDVPEIIMLPIENGSEAYLDWVDDITVG